MKYTTGKYIGPLPHLLGETALLKISEGKVMAQFDNMFARLSPKHWPVVWVDDPHSRFSSIRWEYSDDPPLDALGFGWTEFPLEHWEINNTDEEIQVNDE